MIPTMAPGTDSLVQEKGWARKKRKGPEWWLSPAQAVGEIKGERDIYVFQSSLVV